MTVDALTATLAVTRILERLGLDYLIGGSLASSLHGLPRSTQDADLVVDLASSRVDDLVAALGPGFYVDPERARQAVANRRSFNVIHLPTMFKVDLFVLADDALARLEMARRERYTIGDPGEAVWVATAEDTILQKLLWYRLGRRVSDRQWRDLVAILEVQGKRLDYAYLDGWAERLGLTELLAEARAEAADGIDPRPDDSTR